jgi:hypothetical protein
MIAEADFMYSGGSEAKNRLRTSPFVARTTNISEATTVA